MTSIVERRARDPGAVLFVCDFSPPRGTDPKLLEPAAYLQADFISVAYNPGKSIRLNSAIAAYWIRKNTDREVLFSLATRDMNKIAIQSLLLGAGLMGLENVVILKGDDFSKNELLALRSVNDFKPTELVASVGSMNRGVDFKGVKLQAPTDFCVGATIDLGHDLEHETTLTRLKVKAGAQFFLLQSLFDTDPLKVFLRGYWTRYGEELSLPIFCGIQVMAPDSLVFGPVPEWVTRDLSKGRSGENIAQEVLGRFVGEGFKSIYLVPSIMRGGRRDYEATQRVIEEFRGS